MRISLSRQKQAVLGVRSVLYSALEVLILRNIFPNLKGIPPPLLEEGGDGLSDVVRFSELRRKEIREKKTIFWKLSSNSVYSRRKLKTPEFARIGGYERRGARRLDLKREYFYT